MHDSWELGVYEDNRVQHLPWQQCKMNGLRLLRQATLVADASGEFLGFGAICNGGQSVLDHIEDVVENRA